jgi:hypothetical protein
MIAMLIKILLTPKEREMSEIKILEIDLLSCCWCWRCHSGDEADGAVQDLANDWRGFWVVGDRLRRESHLVEHVSGVWVASGCVTKCQEVVVDERRHKASFSKEHGNDGDRHEKDFRECNHS